MRPVRTSITLAGAVLLAAGAGTAFAQTRLGEMIQVQPQAVIGVATRDAAADKPEGAVVARVEPGMPGEKAGLKEGDTVVQFDGERVRSSSQLGRLVRETPPDRPVRIVVLRDGKRVELTVTPTASKVQSFRFELPSPEFREGPLQRPFRPWLYRGPASPDNDWLNRFRPGPWSPLLPGSPRLGISLQDLTPQLAEYFGTKDGVLVATVEDRSSAATAGLKAGDIITSIDGRDVATTRDVQRALESKRSGDQVRLGIVRDRKAQTITVTVAGERRGLPE